MTVSRRVEPIAWIVALLLAALALVAVGYQTRDPDSQLHVEIETRQAPRPLAEWIAPEWGGSWNSYGLYREHPVGTFVPPMVLIRLGVPAAQAGYVVNAIYQVLTVLLVVALATRVLPRHDARALGWLVQLIPIAFTYRIRANHEQGLLFFVLLALYATDRARDRWRWSLVTAVAMAGAVLVKGIFALLVPPTCAAWLLGVSLREGGLRPEGWTGRLLASLRRDAAAWGGILLGTVVAALVAWGYEEAYRVVTGQSFVAEYLHRQMGAASVQRQAGFGMLLQKVVNAGWYLGRIAWFSFPWSIVLAVVAVRGLVGRSSLAASLSPRRPRADAALLSLLLATAAWVAAFSLFDRRADRFIFPAYFFVTAAGAALALWLSPRMQRVVEKMERLYPFEIVTVWAVTFVLHLGSVFAGMPMIKP